MANQVDYRDPTPNNFPDDYDPAKVDPRVKLRSDSIKHKQKGKHTREAMYEALEIGATIASEAKMTALDTESRQDESEKKVQDIGDNVNNVLGEITENSGDSAAPEMIASRTDDEGNTYPSLGDRLNDQFDRVNIKPVMPNTEIRDEFKQPIQDIKSKIDQNKFNMGFITDGHYETIAKAYPYGYLSLDHYSNILAIQDKVDVLVAGGDNSNSYSLSTEAIKQEFTRIADRMLFTGTKADRFMLLGNHDDGSLRSVYARFNRPIMRSEIMTEEIIKKAYHTDEILFSEKRNGDSLYFYKDYPDKKIRVIGVNTMDIDDTLTKEDGSIKYNRQHDFAVRQEQLEWLANEALMTVPADYHTMVVTHAHATIESVGSGVNLETHHNFDLMMSLLEAFKQGNNVTLVSSEEDFKVNLTAKFADNGPRKLIGYFNGHVHDERISIYTQFGSTYTCVCMLNSVDSKIDERPIGTPEEDAWTVISVDTAAKKVKLLGFGKATDREFDY